MNNYNLGLIELKIGNTIIYKETKLQRNLYNNGFLITSYGVQSVSTKPINEMIGNIGNIENIENKKIFIPFNEIIENNKN
jgi:hypothetical protein